MTSGKGELILIALSLALSLVFAAPQERQRDLEALASIAERGIESTESVANRLIAESSASSDVETGVRARLHLLRHYRLQGRWSEIAQLSAETVALAEAAGLDVLAAKARLARVSALLQLEQAVEAQTVALDVLAAGERLNDTSLQALARLNLSSIAGRGGDVESARRHIEAGLALAIGEPEIQIRLLLNKTLVGQASGDREMASAALSKALSIQLPDPIPELEQTLLLARLSVLVDDPRAAADLAKTVAAEARSIGNSFLAAFADAARAKRLCALGDTAEALELFDAALAFYEQSDIAVEQAKVLDSKAICLKTAGQLDAAFEALSAARNKERQANERQRSEVIASLNAARRESELATTIAEKEQRVRSLQTEAIAKQRNVLLWALAAVVAISLATLVALRARSTAVRAAALQGLQEARSDMLAVAGHEIRNPIQGLMGALTALLHEEIDPHRRQLLTNAHRAVQTIARISNDAFDLSLMDKGQFQLFKRPTRLLDVLRSACDWVSPAAQAKGLNIELQYADEAADVEADIDADRISQVVLNLLTNAVRYSHAGTIRIESAILGDRWRVAVIDHGPGINETELPRLFDAYFRGASATQTQGGGLGLSVAQRIVAAHHGEILASNRPDGGAEFAFWIPLASSVERPAPAQASSLRPLEGLRLLVIDDDELVRLAVRVNAEIAGAIVQDLGDGSRLIKTIREFDPDIVLSDKQLEAEDGIELLRNIRAAFPGPRPRLALMTGSVRTQTLEGPVERILHKPFSSAAFVEAMAELRNSPNASA